MRLARLTVAIVLLINSSLAELDWQQPTSNFTVSSGYGRGVSCCDGDCIDGTTVCKPGQCESCVDLCFDLESPPSCAVNQVLHYNGPDRVDSGDRTCYAPGGCQWQRNYWTYYCYYCPAGYIGVDQGQCDPSDDRCVGCTDPNEILFGNATTGYGCDKISGNCKMNDAGIEMTKCQEVFCPDYYGIAGHKTIGYGHDCCANDDCSSLPPAPLDEDQASQLLACDLAPIEKSMGKLTGASAMNSNQFSAFVDFAFNSGFGSFKKAFRPYIANQDWSGLCDAMGSIKGYGTANRKAAQSQLCNTPTSAVSGCTAPKMARSEITEEDDPVIDKYKVARSQLDLSVFSTRDSSGCPTCKAKPWAGDDNSNCLEPQCSRCAHPTDDGKHNSKCFN